VNLGGIASAPSNRTVRATGLANGHGQQLHTSSGRTVGLKKKAQQPERQSIKAVTQPQQQGRQVRRDAVAERAQSGREQLRAARRQQVQQQPRHHPGAVPLPVMSKPVVLQPFKLAPQFITATPATFAVGATTARSSKKAAQQQQQQQPGKKKAATGKKAAPATSTKKGGKAPAAQQQQQKQRAASKQVGSGSNAGAKRQQGKPGSAKGAKAAAAGGAKAAAVTQDSLDADMDSYMSAAPQVAAV